MSAQILSFPHWPVRAFHIRAADDPSGDWFGEYIGNDGYNGPRKTQVGELVRVVDALLKSANRKGLPIIAPAEALKLAMRKGTPIRPAKRKVLTDRDKYDNAKRKQWLDSLLDDDPGGRAA